MDFVVCPNFVRFNTWGKCSQMFLRSSDSEEIHAFCSNHCRERLSFSKTHPSKHQTKNILPYIPAKATYEALSLQQQAPAKRRSVEDDTTFKKKIVKLSSSVSPGSSAGLVSALKMNDWLACLDNTCMHIKDLERTDELGAHCTDERESIFQE
jgi:hypothetical protein